MVQRDEHGRVKNGSVLNPKGRSKRATEEAYLDILKKEVSADDLQEIVHKAVYDAKRGDSVARKFLADYIIGPPVQRQEVTGENGGAIRIKITGKKPDENV